MLGTALSQGETFKTAPLVLAPGEAPTTMAAGDINRDGKVDLVYWNGEINLLLNQRDGQFQRSSFAGPASFVRLVALVDVNNDQKLDLLITSNSAFQRRLIVLRGKGDGTFEAPITTAFEVPFSVGHPALVAMAAGHLNNDEHLDLILADPANDMLNVLLGHGDGNFHLHATMQQFSATEVVVVDLNRDGELDLFAVSQLGGDVTVRLGLGDGSFGPKIPHTLPFPIRRARFADANGDGLGDLIGISDLGRIEVLAGRGDGTFQLVLQTPEGRAGGSSGRICAATDFNHDGKLDIAITARNGLVVLLGTGDLSFGLPVTYPVEPSLFFFDPILADFNEDGIVDFATTGVRDAPIVLLFGNSDGTFQAADAYDVGAPVNSVASADVNEDGLGDILVGSSRPRISVLVGRQDGLFSFVPQPTELLAGAFEGSQSAADFNGDGHFDSLFSNFLGTLMQFGNGDGTFQNAISVPAITSLRNPLLAAQLDADNHADIAQLTFGGLQIFSGNGDATFQPGVVYATSNSPSSFSSGDFNGDGHVDFAVANAADFNVSVLLGTETTLSPAVNYPVTGNTSKVLTADINGDLDLDLLMLDGTANSAAVLFGDGDGTFSPTSVSPINVQSSQVETGDFNGDGFADLVLSDGVLARVLHGHGDGTFEAAGVYVAGRTPGAPLVQDFNGDESADLAFPNIDTNGTSTVTVLLNRGGTHAALMGFAADSFFTEPVRFLARIREGVAGSGTPTGTVTFKAGNLVLGAAPLESGETNFVSQAISAGLHHISASYSGDDTFNPHHFGDIVHHVVAGTQTSIAASANPSIAGQTVPLTITVSSPSGVPTGTVELHKDGSVVGIAQLAAGAAQISTPALTSGVHIFTVHYLGGPDHLPSTSQFFQFANAAGLSQTTTSLSFSSNSAAPVTPVNSQHILFRESVTLTATVVPAPITGGTVTFYDGSIVLGDSVPVVAGQAVLALPGLSVGARQVRAVYQGDGLQVGGSISPRVVLSRSPRPR